MEHLSKFKPIEIYLINGKLDLLPNAKAIPIGKQNIRQKKDIINVRINLPAPKFLQNLNPLAFLIQYILRRRKYLTRYKINGTIKNSKI